MKRLTVVATAFAALCISAAGAAQLWEPDLSLPEVYKHLRYHEPPESNLQKACPKAGADRNRLLVPARDALTAMTNAAVEDGITLKAGSCFRSFQAQKEVFNCIGVTNGTGCNEHELISREDRATAVAPPGFSEHHTGYAIDFLPTGKDTQSAGCGPGVIRGKRVEDVCYLEAPFRHAPSGEWLANNAHRFGFEMSFPEGNKQGVTYEPWHFRYACGDGPVAVFKRAHERYGASARDLNCSWADTAR